MTETKVNTSMVRIAFSDDVKRALKLKFLKFLPERGRRGDRDHRPARPAAVFSEQFGRMTFESLKIVAAKDGSITSRVIPDGENFAGQTEYIVSTVEEFERLAASIQAHKAEVRAKREAAEAERIANSPEALSKEAGDAIARATKSWSFYTTIDRDQREHRPGPRLDLTAFNDENGENGELPELNARLVAAQLAKDVETLRSIIAETQDVQKRMDKAYLDHQERSLNSRLEAHMDELNASIVHTLTAQIRTIVETFEKDGDAQKARRALVDVDKVISGQVRQARGGTYAPRERNDSRTHGRPGFTMGDVARGKRPQASASERDSRR